MPLLLRTVRQNRWLKERAADLLAVADCPSDALGDLATSNGGRLSVYEVAADRSNLERIVRAVAITKDKLSAHGWLLFDSALLDAIGINSDSKVPGNTPDRAANQWHVDLTDLTGNRLVALARALLHHGETGTVLEKRLRELVLVGIEQSELPEALKSKFKL